MPVLTEFLAWDSQYFGKRVGKLDLQPTTALDESLHHAYQQRYEILYIYSPIPIEKSLIGNYALLDVGGHITFRKNLSGHSAKMGKPTSEVCEYPLADPTPELLEIAFLSGHLSRFKIDHSLPVDSFERLYETWLVKSLGNHPNAKIYIYEVDDRTAGLITVDWNGSKCTIGLLAVLEFYQGRGIATKLINHVEHICNTRKSVSLEVKTQLSNASARTLYIKNSFAEKDRSFLYHAHIIKHSIP
jgi:dTDP-4-amino-4,6-dideoxy-D-galactose acyltransferase